MPQLIFQIPLVGLKENIEVWGYLWVPWFGQKDSGFQWGPQNFSIEKAFGYYSKTVSQEPPALPYQQQQLATFSSRRGLTTMWLSCSACTKHDPLGNSTIPHGQM